MGSICIKVWGLALLILSHLSLISHENEIIWSHSETILFHFHWIFNSREPPEPPLDPPL